MPNDDLKKIWEKVDARMGPQRMETEAEHIARDMREGNFPKRSDPIQVPVNPPAMTDDELNKAIAHITRITPPSAPWNCSDLGGGRGPVLTDSAIATILNAVASGTLIPKEEPRFPDHMAEIVAMKTEGLPARIATLVTALQAIPDYLKQYQWQADEKQAFGSKWVRSIAGDNGKGAGRQAIAEVVGHLDVADFIAAANPDTIALLLSELNTAQQAASKADAQAGALLREAAEYHKSIWASQMERADRLFEMDYEMSSEDAKSISDNAAEHWKHAEAVLSIAPDATAALERALLAAREVRELVWEDNDARSPLGDIYTVIHLSENVWQTRKNGTAFSGWESTGVAAKAAAQQDYAALVTAALKPLGGEE